MAKPKIAVILGSTRDTRFGEKPARWFFELAQQRDDLDFEFVDLRDFDLPFFNEPASNLWMPSSDPKAVAWQQKVGEFDGYVFVTAEYNRSIPASLKNALDQCYKEWNRKPAAFVGYGSVGGARAVEHLRNICVELQMVPVRAGVHIGGSEFFTVSPLGANKEMAEIEQAILPGAQDLLENLAWWTKATKAAREA